MGHSKNIYAKDSLTRKITIFDSLPWLRYQFFVLHTYQDMSCVERGTRTMAAAPYDVTRYYSPSIRAQGRWRLKRRCWCCSNWWWMGGCCEERWMQRRRFSLSSRIESSASLRSSRWKRRTRRLSWWRRASRCIPLPTWARVGYLYRVEASRPDVWVDFRGTSIDQAYVTPSLFPVTMAVRARADPWHWGID